jgi:hypothetical protein
MSEMWYSGDDEGRAGLAAIGTWQQELLLFSLPQLQPLQIEELGEVLLWHLICKEQHHPTACQISTTACTSVTSRRDLNNRLGRLC